MMLALGMFVFMRQTLPHQTMQRDAEYLWPSNSRVGKRNSFQYLGPGKKNYPGRCVIPGAHRWKVDDDSYSFNG